MVAWVCDELAGLTNRRFHTRGLPVAPAEFVRLKSGLRFPDLEHAQTAIYRAPARSKSSPDSVPIRYN
jgi:hypothetical protein